jgi:WD40 repeat protein
MAPADLVTTFDGHHAAVNALDLAEDGTLYSAGKDGRLKLWDMNTSEMLTEIEACQTAINDVAVDPLTGSYFVTAGDDGWIKVWDSLTLELLQVIYAHDGPANCVAIGLEGTVIYSGGDDGYLRAYSVERDYEMNWEVHANFGGVNDLVENPYGGYIFACGVDGRVIGYTGAEGYLISDIQAVDNGEALTMAFSANEACLVVGGTNGNIYSYDGTTGSRTHILRAHAGDVNYIAYNNDGKLLVSGGADGKIKLWNRDYELAGEMQAHVLAVSDFVMNLDTLVTGGADFKIRVWDSKF